MKVFFSVVITFLVTSFGWYCHCLVREKAAAINRKSDIDAPMGTIIHDLVETADKGDTERLKVKLKLMKTHWDRYYFDNGKKPEQFAPLIVDASVEDDH